MRVFLDTNVLVSAFATRGLSADVLRLVLAEHELLTSEPVLDELGRVLREKLRASQAAIDSALELLRSHHVEPRPRRPHALPVEDEDDRWIVASALACDSEVLVTGDRMLLQLETIDELRILSPRMFWERLSGRRQ